MDQLLGIGVRREHFRAVFRHAWKLLIEAN